MIELTDQEFVMLRDYVLNNFGIDLSKKRVLIQGRLTSTLREKGFADYTQYIQYVINDKTGVEVNLLLNKLTTNLTFFMREPKHFEFVEKVLLPQFEKEKKSEIRVWSAGCSSGEEPYSLAMTIMDYFGSRPKPKISILASDISQKVLGAAQQGIYKSEGLGDLPPGWQSKYFNKIGPDEYQVKEEVRSTVTFRTVNLMSPFRFKAPFEIIFCRNVMIYFEKERKADLIKRFYQWVRPGYYFFISHSENIDRKDSRFSMVQPSVFRRDV